MIRKLIIAGNWKMNNLINEAKELVRNVIKEIEEIINNKIEIVICPPYTTLYSVNELLKKSKIKLGAQNLYPIEKGAYTGEISPLMLKDVGCQFVIIGHSERRNYFDETNEFINKKIKFALKYNLIPIFCIGEKLEEREKGQTYKVIEKQLIEGLKDLSIEQIENIIVAYEPVWAIGTGHTATSSQAEEVHLFIRNLLKQNYDRNLSQNIRIQYGGSVTPTNIEELIKEKNIDGVLVGGASLKISSFVEIIYKAYKIIKNE